VGGDGEARAAAREPVAKKEAALPALALTDADFDQLLVEVTVRADCENASTRSTPDGLVLTRCSRDVAVGGGCPVGCAGCEPRRVGGLGTGT
jgi:hypothetical protein